jgi:hypothetical protein
MGTAILLIALGAVLWLIGFTTIGLILLIVGAIGAVLSMAFWSTWGGWHRGDRVVERRY